jgi:3-hydroxyacyl-CoA dehydrogenase
MASPTLPHSFDRVAVLGSGVMGSAIACHLAQTGHDVLLLDLPAKEGPRNAVADGHLKACIKSKPSPLYRKAFAKRIKTGNFEDDMPQIAGCDWIIEVIVERLDIKQIVFAQVEEHRKPGTPITSNTSGIPIGDLAEGRSEDFQACFCGTHFFNPPRYLALLEIIPHGGSDPALIDFFMAYGRDRLGKTTVLCKDTPAFIANRVGVFAIQALFHTVQDMGLSIEAVDKLTGPAMGRPKSATFRTCDVVGLDTLVHVANGVKDNCPDDERKAVFETPKFVQHLVDNGHLGSKSGQGFYKKTKVDGKKAILGLDLETLEYRPKPKVKYATLDAAKKSDDLAERTRILYDGQDEAGTFYRRVFSDVFAYVTHRIPEIADEPYRIDDALRAGFGWEMGAFETMDAVGVSKAVEQCEAHGQKVAQWVHDFLAAGNETFYTVSDGVRSCYNPGTKAYEVVPGQEGRIKLAYLGEEKVVWKNAGVTLHDLGDGILNVGFHTKMNTIGAEILQGLNHAFDIAEDATTPWRGVVISNEGGNFSAGANVGMVFMLAVEQEYDELDYAVRMFQNTVMRARYSSIPVVVATHQMTLGGACELSMHADKVIAHAETYMGLVEFGVGLIPGGAGTKEFAVRASDEYTEGGIRLEVLRERFLTVGQAKVATSAHEAFDLGYLRPGIDEVELDRSRLTARAKVAALAMADSGYVPPRERTDIKVLGQEGLGIVHVGAHSMKSAGYISDHDQLISVKLGTVLCGGDLSAPTEVSERYLLDMERRAFCELCRERKSLERMQSLIQSGKILRN